MHVNTAVLYLQSGQVTLLKVLGPADRLRNLRPGTTYVVRNPKSAPLHRSRVPGFSTAAPLFSSCNSLRGIVLDDLHLPEVLLVSHRYLSCFCTSPVLRVVALQDSTANSVAFPDVRQILIPKRPTSSGPQIKSLTN